MGKIDRIARELRSAISLWRWKPILKESLNVGFYSFFNVLHGFLLGFTLGDTTF